MLATTNCNLENSKSFCIYLVYPITILYQLLRLIFELFDFVEHPNAINRIHSKTFEYLCIYLTFISELQGVPEKGFS